MLNKLTVRLPDEPIYIPDENKWSVTDEFGAKCLIGEVVDRLAAYEDSGLSPEEVQELAKAKAEGRLIVLPCKVGDAVWKIKAVFSYFSKPMEDRVERIIISSNEILVEDRVERIIISSNEILVCCTSGTKFSVNSIGKTVFLTEMEAKEVLKCQK